jgi:hypothetical protein
MPSLEELIVSAVVDTRDPADNPWGAIQIAGDYIVPAFRLIRTFRLSIGFKFSQKVPAGLFLREGTRDAFARLDGLLTEKTTLQSLREVEISLGPLYLGDGGMEDELSEALSNRIRSEVLEVLPGTGEQVYIFAVTTSRPSM